MYRRESVAGVRDEETCFAHCSVTDRHALYEPRCAHFPPLTPTIIRKKSTPSDLLILHLRKQHLSSSQFQFRLSKKNPRKCYPKRNRKCERERSVKNEMNRCIERGSRKAIGRTFMPLKRSFTSFPSIYSHFPYSFASFFFDL